MMMVFEVTEFGMISKFSGVMAQFSIDDFRFSIEAQWQGHAANRQSSIVNRKLKHRWSLWLYQVGRQW